MTTTEQQRAAIESNADRILCVSGPGSGKTATLINRIFRLVRDGAQPENMAAITYTNSAAVELAARLAPEDGSIRLSLGFVGTLHSFCLRHLQENGYEGWAVLDQQEADEELQRVARDCNVDEGLKKLKAWREDYHRAASRGIHPPFSTRLVIGNYYRKLEGERLLDYDSILSLGLKSLRVAYGLKEEREWCHLFVDEFQDASELDALIYELVSAQNRFYVGDPRQAIFSFKGSNVKCFERLMGDPAWTKIELTHNFRSAPDIIEAANRLMAHSDLRTAPMTEAPR